MNTNEFLTSEALAKELDVPEQTLKNWRSNGRYNLPFIKLGRSVRYRREDVDRFLSERTVSPMPLAKEGQQ